MVNAGIPIQYMDPLGMSILFIPFFGEPEDAFWTAMTNGNGVAFVLVVFSRMALATETTSKEAGRFIS